MLVYDKESHSKFVISKAFEVVRTVFQDKFKIVTNVRIVKDHNGGWRIPVFMIEESTNGSQVSVDKKDTIFILTKSNNLLKVDSSIPQIIFDIQSTPD